MWKNLLLEPLALTHRCLPQLEGRIPLKSFSYQIWKFLSIISINKSCMNRSVKIYFSTGDFDPTLPFLHPKKKTSIVCSRQRKINSLCACVCVCVCVCVCACVCACVHARLILYSMYVIYVSIIIYLKRIFFTVNLYS
jgi:hypothetical protein